MNEPNFRREPRLIDWRRALIAIPVLLSIAAAAYVFAPRGDSTTVRATLVDTPASSAGPKTGVHVGQAARERCVLSHLRDVETLAEHGTLEAPDPFDGHAGGARQVLGAVARADARLDLPRRQLTLGERRAGRLRAGRIRLEVERPGVDVSAAGLDANRYVTDLLRKLLLQRANTFPLRLADTSIRQDRNSHDFCILSAREHGRDPGERVETTTEQNCDGGVSRRLAE